MTCINADFHRAVVATAPGEKTPHRAPPCEELDPPYDIKFVLCRKLHLFLGKSTKTAATRAALFDSNMHQIICRLRLRPRPTGELTALPQPLAVFRGPTYKERGSEGRERGELVGA